MKLSHALIVSLTLVVLLSLLMTSTANAQEFEAVPPTIADVLVRIGVIIDGVLGHWVSGNALSEQGVTFVGSIGTMVVNTTHFLALLVTLF
jgi:hypothetical protein